MRFHNSHASRSLGSGGDGLQTIRNKQSLAHSSFSATFPAKKEGVMHRKASCNKQEYTIWSEGSLVTVRRNDGETPMTGSIISEGAPFSDALRDIKVDSGGDDVLLGEWRLSRQS